MTDAPELPRKLMLLIAAVQGIALLFLYDAMESGTWPSASPLWNFPMWLIAIAVPVLLLLSLEEGKELRAARLIGVFAVILIALGVYTGWQATPYDEFPVYNLTWVFALSLGLGCFKALMYLQQRVAEKPMSYEVLFTYSWRNALTIALSLVLTFVFWLILMLWAQLFRAIEVDFFYDLFREDWFLFPVLSVAHGVGVIIFRNLTRVIDSITRLFEGLIKILLPLAVIVAVVFLGALPVVGLDALWSTGRGTSLLLWLLAVILFFTNAVYQDGRGERPYPVIMHRIVYVALLTMPLLSILSFYGLYLRLEEYGWTVIRGWAFITWLVLTLFVVGYSVGIVRKRDDWTTDLAKVNTGMGLVVLFLMMVVNSPVLDLRKLSLNSQVGRVESGRLELADFDFWYARQSLARPGYLFVERKIAELGDSDPDLVDKMNNPVPSYRAQALQTTENLWANMRYRPERFEVPESVREKIDSYGASYPPQVETVLIRADLDNDGVDEYLHLLANENYFQNGQLYYTADDQWKNITISIFPNSGNVSDTLANADVEIVRQRFGNVRLGNFLLRPLEEE
ncbi:MAG: DUF4153 domain-containing protein [Woeseiaceae bacterium]